MRISQALVIDRSPEDVFGRLTQDVAQEEPDSQPPDRPSVGAIFGERMGPRDRDGDLAAEVLSWKPGREFAVRLAGPRPWPTFVYRVRLAPEARGARTRVTVGVEAHLNGAWRLLEPFAARALHGWLERAVWDDLVRAKDELEGRRPAQTPAAEHEEPHEEPGPFRARRTLRTALPLEECRRRLAAGRFVWHRPSTWLDPERDHTISISVSHRGFSLRRKQSAARRWPLVARGRLVPAMGGGSGAEVHIRFGAPRAVLLDATVWLIGLAFTAVGTLAAWTSPIVDVVAMIAFPSIMLAIVIVPPALYVADQRRARLDAPYLLRFLQRRLEAVEA